MLLVARAYLEGHPDLDIYCASWAVPEVVLLGSTLGEIPHLGEEGSRKLAELPKMPDLDVTSTIFELLVGVASLRRGRRLQMLPASKVSKSPDFRVHDLTMPTTIECKRRQGLFDYELQEAVAARAVYDALCSARGGTLAGWIFDVEFSVPLPSVAVSEVVGAAQAAAQVGEAQTGPWGTVVARELPHVVSLASTTRLYSPSLLAEVFGWDFHSQDWDGLICTTAQNASAIVDSVRGAGALRWRSSSEEALIKKARGVTSLYGKAVQQIPVGEMGIIYICYDEGARTNIADARTREIMEACREWYYDGIKIIPLIVVSRLYHCPKSIGAPDLIEDVIPMFAGDEPDARASMLRTFPTLVFTPSA